MIINNSLNLLYIRQDVIYFNQNSNTIICIVDFDYIKMMNEPERGTNHHRRCTV